MYYPEPISKLVDSFTKLPGIGPKTAVRLAFFVLSMEEDDVLEFGKALVNAKRELTHCSNCGHITDKDPCNICTDPNRDNTLICVVQDPKDVIAMEKMKDFQGRYHVLNGAISPMDGIGPEDINVTSLIERLKDEEVEELILATNPTGRRRSNSDVYFPVSETGLESGQPELPMDYQSEEIWNMRTEVTLVQSLKVDEIYNNTQ